MHKLLSDAAYQGQQQSARNSSRGILWDICNITMIVRILHAQYSKGELCDFCNITMTSRALHVRCCKGVLCLNYIYTPAPLLACTVADEPQ